MTYICNIKQRKKTNNMKSIHFNIQGRHTSHNGSADVINSENEIKSLYANHFNIYENIVSVNRIGISCIEGVNYEIYESYYDSASNDYLYFAVKSDIPVFN